MSVALLALYAAGVSLLTLFSGFGLGTLLMPAFALVIPVEAAVAATAVVHAANNVFKVGLLARDARGDIVLRFGVPAMFAALFGALLLTRLAGQEPLLRWAALGTSGEITPLKLVMGLLIVGFAAFELVPALRRLRAPVRWLPLGGLLSGFFGGLSGHQGALRAAFLAPLGLAPAAFAATQATIALLVDGMRLLVYGATLLGGGAPGGDMPWRLIAIVTLAAFAGAWLGKRLLPKLTIASLRWLVGALLLAVGTALAAGIA